MKYWSPKRPVVELPERLHSFFSDCAFILGDELQSHRLRIVLVPAPEKNFSSHKIRVVEERNPDWYSSLWNCHKWMERRRLIPAIGRVCELQDRVYDGVHFYYDFLVRDLVKEMFVDGFVSYEGERVAANSVVRNYFCNPQKFLKSLEQKVSDVPF